MDTERREIRGQLKLLALRNYVAFLSEPVTKSAELSTEARLDGNALYELDGHSAKQHQAIIEFYSKSVALAPTASEELALAYSNRSAALWHISKLRECLRDVDRALEITGSLHLRIKLYCRKTRCLSILGLPGGKDALDKAAECLAKLEEEDAKKASLARVHEQAKEVLEAVNRPRFQEYDNSKSKEILARLERQDLFSFVEMKYSKEQGRYLTAARNYRPGDILFIEKPYAVFHNDSVLSYLYCTHCLSLALAGLPCDFCSWCLFCSEECKREAWEKYHEIECPIMPHVTKPKSHSMCLKMAVRVFAMMIKEAGSIDKLKAEVQEVDHDKENYKRCYSSTKFDSLVKVVYSLSSNDSQYFLNKMLEDLTMTLLYVIQFPPFSEQGEFVNATFSEIVKNKNFLFIGCFLLKLTKIISSNKFFVNNFLFKSSLTSNYDTNEDIDIHYTSMKGISLQLIGSFFNNCCSSAANAEKFYTEDSKVVLYAIEPIKQNSQIFIDYFGTYHQYENYVSTKLELKRQYGFDCHCIACKNRYVQNTPTRVNFNMDNNTFKMDFFAFRDAIEKSYKASDLRNIRDKLRNNVEEACKIYKKTQHQLGFVKNTLSLTFIQEYGQSERAFVKCN